MCVIKLYCTTVCVCIVSTYCTVPVVVYELHEATLASYSSASLSVCAIIYIAGVIG